MTGVTTSPPAIAAPIAMPSAARAMITTMPTMTPIAARQHPARRARAASRAAARGDRTSRPMPSRATSVAAARPARIEPELDEERAGGTRRPWRCRCPGRRSRAGAAKSGDLPSCSTNDRPDPAMHASRRCPARGPRRAAVGRCLAERSRRPGRASPTSARGRLGVGSARGTDVAADERLDADDEAGRSRRRATRTSDGQSYWPASGRWLVVQPNQVRFGDGAERRDRRLVAVEEEAAEHQRAGDARPPRRVRGTARARTRPSRRRAPSGRARSRSRRRPRPGSRRPAASRTCRPPAMRQEDHDATRPPGRRCARTASRGRSAAASAAPRRRTRGFRVAPRRRACPTGRGSTTGWRRAGRTCRTCTGA